MRVESNAIAARQWVDPCDSGGLRGHAGTVKGRLLSNAMAFFQ